MCSKNQLQNEQQKGIIRTFVKANNLTQLKLYEEEYNYDMSFDTTLLELSFKRYCALETVLFLIERNNVTGIDDLMSYCIRYDRRDVFDALPNYDWKPDFVICRAFEQCDDGFFSMWPIEWCVDKKKIDCFITEIGNGFTLLEVVVDGTIYSKRGSDVVFCALVLDFFREERKPGFKNMQVFAGCSELHNKDVK
jgi:hypothetical protein